MKTKLLAVALLASAALIAPVQAGGGNHGGGGGGFGGGGGRGGARGGAGPSVSSMPGRNFGGGGSFRSMPMRSFSGNRAIYSGQRFSSVGGQMPRSMEFRPRYANTRPNTSIQSRQFENGNVTRGVDGARLANRGNHALQNPGRAGNRAAQAHNGNGNLRPDWQKHVFAQHSGNWHRDWNRNADHWWHGHRCHFFNGSWVIFDVGFYPWWGWPYWDPYYYGYGYGYGYGYYDYPYGYESNYYGEQYDDQNAYADQSANSTIAAVQERLVQDGYYRGQIDGVFGPETRAALAQFQSNHGLRVSGALTNDTLAALGLRRVASY
jgi:Putative peptidoglycan binding domain